MCPSMIESTKLELPAGLVLDGQLMNMCMSNSREIDMYVLDVLASCVSVSTPSNDGDLDPRGEEWGTWELEASEAHSTIQHPINTVAIQSHETGHSPGPDERYFCGGGTKADSGSGDMESTELARIWVGRSPLRRRGLWGIPALWRSINPRRNDNSTSSGMTYGGPWMSPFCMSSSRWDMVLSFSC